MKSSLLFTISFVLSFVLLFSSVNPSFASATSPQSVLFFDDFNDGNTDGWLTSLGSFKEPGVIGNWRSENGVFVNDMGGDGFPAVVENVQFSDQIVKTWFKLNGPAGYGGILFWFHDPQNYVHVSAYPPGGWIGAGESFNGTGHSYNYLIGINYGEWYHLELQIDSISGDILVYLNHDYLFTFETLTPNRDGQSGLLTGNSGVSFDDFTVTSRDIPSLRLYLPLINR